MSGSSQRIPEVATRPPSYTAGIYGMRPSRPEPSRTPSMPRASISAGPSREAPRAPSEAAQTILPPQEAVSAHTQTRLCESCEVETSPVWDCSYCDMMFCDICWDKQGPHKAGRTGPDGLPHEKANPTIVKRLQNILTPPQNHSQQHILHNEDKDTTWFGVVRNSQNSPVFQDYGRYSAIMADSNSGDFKFRYPQLVSFIGQTGAGKSTLIKMLIDQQERMNPDPTRTLPSPVAGTTSNGNVPTSGDVHLYSDPSTYATEYPRLYADCEGLEGGENIPMAAQYLNNGITPKEKGREDHPTKESRRHRMVSKSFHSTQREIKWANSPEKSKRQYAVTELYPRLLYTFSDVIVFVLRNAKTFESTVMGLLIKWAQSSFDKSLNQPTLPHAVIALNATDTKVGQEEWDPEYTTEMLMSSVAGAIDRDPTYSELRDQWIRRGRTIRTMKDLLECYYSSITVVRVPGEGRYMMIDDQVKKLYHVIARQCVMSYHAKRKSRMLSNSETLNVYLQCAFDHFSQDLHSPFDFMDISFKINPIPLDFGGNITKLAVAMKAHFDDPRKIFNELSHMVASCILLDCVRQDLKGSAEQLLEMQYMEHCDFALDDFCALFWPCSFVNKRGERCCNVKERHAKGHQNARGAIIGAGSYQSSFTFDNFCEEWAAHLKHYLTMFQGDLESQLTMSRTANEVVVTTKLHHGNVTNFYHQSGGASNFVSHATCFCCLRELAEHPLPCRHVLCTACVKGYGRPHDELSGSIKLETCPLHDFDTIFPNPVEIYFKPSLAGLRILSLDGGGIRGIVILEVLRRIQQELGGRIKIQEFFDLIVGTSTGGILALGLGVKNWSVDRCRDLFLKMVQKAFTARILGVTWGKTKYRTQPLEEALNESFKDEPLFGWAPNMPLGNARKIAVTSATETADQAVIFTNYNRADDEQIEYQLVRPDDPRNDLLIREAARATSAAPTYFRPFKNPRTMEGYVDGAIFHNNPVRIAVHESKLLWPDTDQRPPDILLSVGTGQNGTGSDGFLDGSHHDNRRFQIRKMIQQVKPMQSPKRSMPVLRPFPEFESWLTIFKKRVESALDAEATWREFRKDVVGSSSHAAAERFLRVNPRTRDAVPKMDDKAQLEKLQENISSSLAMPGMQAKIRGIARRLVASSFYFEKTSPPRPADDHIIVQGDIQCKFAAGSNNLRALGDYVRRQQTPHFQPFFRIQEDMRDEASQCVPVTAQIIRDMTDRGLFNLESIVIPVSSEVALVVIELFLIDSRTWRREQCGYPISGFPRQLADGGEALKKTTSQTALPQPERPKMSNKRQSLRERRHAARVTSPRPGSESSSFSATRSELALDKTSQDEAAYPEMDGEEPEWMARRRKAARPTPRPMSAETYELDARPILASGGDGNTVAGASPSIEMREDYGERSIAESEDEASLALAIELSQQEVISAPRRVNTGGFDEDQIEEALKRSIQVSNRRQRQL